VKKKRLKVSKSSKNFQRTWDWVKQDPIAKARSLVRQFLSKEYVPGLSIEKLELRVADFLCEEDSGLAELITTKQLKQLLIEEMATRLSEKTSGRSITCPQHLGESASQLEDPHVVDDAEKDESPMHSRANQVKSFFVYLKELCLIAERLKLDLNRCNPILWQQDLPLAEDCKIMPEKDKSGAWLLVKKRPVPEPPDLPASLIPWAEKRVWGNPDEEPTVRKYRSLEEGAREGFEDDYRRVNQWQQWLNNKWRPWAQLASYRRRVWALWKVLYLQSQRLEREQDQSEMIWGHCVLHWSVDGQAVSCPVLVTKVSIEMDTYGETLRVVPDPQGPLLETDFVHRFRRLVDEPIMISNLIAWYEDNPLDPCDDGAVRSFAEQFISLLDINARIVPQGKGVHASTCPVVSVEPVLFVRPKSHGYRADIENVIAGIDEGKSVPAVISSLLGLAESSQEHEDGRSDGEEVLFPLPANDEQWKIVERLSRHMGVTVQGPPGTGKSHTIANLISHMLSKGKRVLITAKAERPLRVLREMLPDTLRSLCVAVIGHESTYLKQLEDTVEEICSRIGSFDREPALGRVERLRESLKQTRADIALCRSKLKDISKTEATCTYRLKGQEHNLADLGKWLRDNESELGFIPDDIPEEASLPLSLKQLARLYELAGVIRREDREFLAAPLPDAAALPTVDEIQSLFGRIDVLQRKLVGQRPPHNLAVDLECVEKTLERFAEAKVALETFGSSSWSAEVLQDTLLGGLRKKRWEELYEWLTEAVMEWERLDRALSAHKVVFPEDRPLAETKNLLLAAKEYMARGGGSLWRFMKPTVNRLLRSCSVDGAPINDIRTLEAVISAVDQVILLEKISTRWNREIESLGGSKLDMAPVLFSRSVLSCAEKIWGIFMWKDGEWDPLVSDLRQIGINVPAEVTPDVIDDIRCKLNLLREHLVLEQGENRVAELYRMLNLPPNKGPIWSGLQAALKTRAWDEWARLRKEIDRLQSVRVLEQELQVLRSKLEKVTPSWASEIIAKGGSGIPLTMPPRVLDAWEWKKADTWLRSVLENDPDSLARRLDELCTKERSLVKDLISESTWLRLAERVTEEERQSLVAWQQLMKRIGKRKGKYVPRYYAEARRKMKEARGAVPVWVMPVDEVVRSFDTWDEPFDLVIVDESSQVDLFGSLALFRARKVLIVGDDKQISPMAVGVDLSQIHDRMETYLKDFPHAKLLEPKYSLYDLGKRAFPGVVMLREHFRCLPEIIQFSNDLMYEGRILPLRERGGGLGDDWRPVVAQWVMNGFRTPGKDINEPEAEALVDCVIECCKDPRYHKMSMGVISLLGQAQADLIEEMLLDRLGPEEMKKRKLICGDAYHFQGDERAVMFLSLVEAEGEHRRAVLNKQDDYRRFNVAASRAKNQMWLFYSIDPGRLHPEDVRARLIRYCMNPARIQEDYSDLASRCESNFERRVLRDLIHRGYSVKTQYRVGHKRIDLVVEGLDGRRLAVECDGVTHHGPEQWEDDWSRQLMLERLGWKFYRIRSSAYYRGPDRTIGELMAILEDMGITPSNCPASPN